MVELKQCSNCDSQSLNHSNEHRNTDRKITQQECFF